MGHEETKVVRTIILIASVALLALCLVMMGSLDVEGTESEQYFLRGDINLDGQICMGDSIFLIFHLWRDGRELPCMEVADLDNDRCIDMMDVICGLRHVFHGAEIEPPLVPVENCFLYPDN